MKAKRGKALRILGSQSGETIGETLVALLIAALALTMLAGAITASGNMIAKGRKKLKEYYDHQDIIELMEDDSKGKDATMNITGSSVSQTQNILLFVCDETYGDIQIAGYKIKTGS